MIISALKSSLDSDLRSPIHIDTVNTLTNLGTEIFFEEGIGDGINVGDDIFEQSGLKKCSRENCLKKGDLILLANYAHGFKMLEESILLEVKQGPYLIENDKIHINKWYL